MVRRRGPAAGAVGAVAVGVAVLLIALGGCAGGSDDGTTVAGAGDAGDTSGDGSGGEDGAPAGPDAAAPAGAAASPTEGGDGVAPMLRTVDVPCPAELGYLTSRSGRSCYQLGESGGLGADIIASASVEADGRYGEVKLVMTDAGIARFNGLAAQCVAASPTCPTGRVAFVANRAVVSTPTITRSDYGPDEVKLTGPFSADDARAIAEALDP